MKKQLLVLLLYSICVVTIHAQGSVLTIGNNHIFGSTHLRTNDGGVLTAAVWSPNTGYFVKTDSLNNLEWSFAVPLPVACVSIMDPFELCSLPGGGYVALLKGTAVVLKFSLDGSIDWTKYYSDSLSSETANKRFYDLTVDEYGRILLAGCEPWVQAAEVLVIDTNGVVKRSLNYSS